jgi:hypothetical protein
MLMHQGEDRRPVIIGLGVDLPCLAGAAIIAVAAVGAVEPELKQLAVARTEFDDLFAVIVEIAGAAIFGVIAVPG